MNLADSGSSVERSMPAATSGAVRIEAPARLHLGFVDPSATLGRRFGSLGVAIDTLATELRISHAGEDAFCGVDAASSALVARIERHVGVLRQRTGFDTPLRVVIERTPPPHAGFGSGTQLALALGHAFARLHRIELATADVAQMLARGERSGVGVAAFDRGGFILDGGPASDGRVAPMLARFDFPSAWRIVLALDVRQSGLHGETEASAIAALPRFDRACAADVAHEIVMRMLPAVAEGDFDPFADSITRVQRILGDYFAPAQGGSMYTSPDVASFLHWVQTRFRAGIGQSSWGPTGFAVVPSANVAECVIADARAAQVVTSDVRLMIVSGRNHGAAVTAG